MRGDGLVPVLEQLVVDATAAAELELGAELAALLAFVSTRPAVPRTTGITIAGVAFDVDVDVTDGAS